MSSRIDYCNSLLYGIPEYAIKKLQRVQNLAARVVTRSSKYSSITPTLKEEIALAACEVSDHIQSSAAHLQSTAWFGSETGNLLIMPKARRKLGCQSFAAAAPKLWNDLPVNIRTTTSIVSFRSSLKTHLFKLAYA